jgi:hypothetical protein
VRLGTDAVFVVTGLPTGEYFLAAVTDFAPAQATDPALLELMAAAAVRVRVVEGERTVQDIRLGR